MILFFMNKITNKLKDHQKYSPDKISTNSLNTFHEVSSDEVLKIIVSSIKATTCATDLVPSKLIKNNISVLCRPVITKLVNIH